MNLGWHFDKMGKMGGSHSGAYRNPLSNSGLVKEHKLAREAIQNSVDARREGGVVRVRFRQQSVDEQRINQIADDLQLLIQTGPTERGLNVEGLGLEAGHFFEAALDADTHPQNVLFVEDYDTMGLGGKLNGSYEEDDRYYRLILGFGVEDESEESRGGSYGFGKSVYPDASNVNTVVYYSVFEPTEDTYGSHARLIVASLFNTHTYQDEIYTGRAWFGNKVEEDFCAPLTDGEAHDFAARLGFEPRSQSDFGTSMMILGSDVNLDEIKNGVENHWWPRLIDEEIIVEFWGENERLDDPDPRAQPQLRRYIQCYQAATAANEVDQDDLVCQRFRRSAGLRVGYCAATLAEPEAFRDDDAALEPTFYPGLNEVALIRSPKMVVAYQSLSDGIDVVGVFVADVEIDGILKLSEPSDHTRWARDSNRLKEPLHKRLVQGLPSRINRTVETLRRKFNEEIDEPSGSPRALEELLGDVFRTRRGGGGGGGSDTSSAFDVDIDTVVNIEQEAATLSGVVKIVCREQHVLDTLVCKAALSAHVLQDDTRRPDELLDLEITSTRDCRGNEIEPIGTYSCVLSVDKINPAEISFQTSGYAPYEVCNVRVSAEVAD